MWKKAIPVSLLLLSSPMALANGGHFLVDDADIVPAGECALESWVQRADGANVFATNPICTTQNGWEFTLPLVYNISDSQAEEVGLEAKTIVSDDFMGGAVTVSFGGFYDLDNDTLLGGFVNIPFSRAAAFGMVHVNLGAEYDDLASAWDPTWGLATTHAITGQQELILEVAGAGSDTPTAAVGTRLANGGIELDASVGRDFEHNDNIFTLGLNLAF